MQHVDLNVEWFLADMFIEAPVEAASLNAVTVAVLGAGLRRATEDAKGALGADWGALAILLNESSHRVFWRLLVVLAAVRLALGGLAPVAAVARTNTSGRSSNDATMETSWLNESTTATPVSAGRVGLVDTATGESPNTSRESTANSTLESTYIATIAATAASETSATSETTATVLAKGSSATSAEVASCLRLLCSLLRVGAQSEEARNEYNLEKKHLFWSQSHRLAYRKHSEKYLKEF